MIISASRRTDIPAFYDEWLRNRIRKGSVLVRNPMNRHQVGSVSLSPDVVDGFVFWSKNPAPMLSWIEELAAWPYYFQFTLNPYGNEVEPNLPGLQERIGTMLRLAEKVGPDRVVWRYDPILLSAAYPVDWHTEQFGRMAEALKGAVKRCTISFLDLYRNMAGRVTPLLLYPIGTQEMRKIGGSFAVSARENGMELYTCAEAADLSAFGIGHASCVDSALLGALGGCSLLTGKDKNQRRECGCAESIDIGLYHSCPHGCLYCYANWGGKEIQKNNAAYDAASPLLCSCLQEGDIVKERAVRSCRDTQLQLRLDGGGR